MVYDFIQNVKNGQIDAFLGYWAPSMDSVIEPFLKDNSVKVLPKANLEGAKYTLEFALMADGVPVKDVYKVLASKEGQDRAFKKLDELKPNIQWWEAGAQPPQRVRLEHHVVVHHEQAVAGRGQETADQQVACRHRGEAHRWFEDVIARCQPIADQPRPARQKLRRRGRECPQPKCNPSPHGGAPGYVMAGGPAGPTSAGFVSCRKNALRV
jgi:hypothetical protein